MGPGATGLQARSGPPTLRGWSPAVLGPPGHTPAPSLTRTNRLDSPPTEVKHMSRPHRTASEPLEPWGSLR